MNTNNSQNNSLCSKSNLNQLDIEKYLNFANPKFKLALFDVVSVRSSIGYELQRQVKVEGEVLYPVMYTIISKDERVSDLLKRAGGLTALGYAKGASLKREGPAKADGKNAIDQKEEDQNKIAKLQRLQENVKDTVGTKVKEEVLKNVYVGIQLDKIIENPGTQTDLILEEGDVLRIPKQLQTVKVNGEILYPVTTVFSQGKGFKHYISQGGGFSNKSFKRRSYVIYANGSVKSTSKVFFFNKYAEIEPGAEIFVPKREEGRKLSAGELVGLSTGFASLAAIVLSLIR